jgi:hypothetical protein
MIWLKAKSYLALILAKNFWLRFLTHTNHLSRKKKKEILHTLPTMKTMNNLTKIRAWERVPKYPDMEMIVPQCQLIGTDLSLHRLGFHPVPFTPFPPFLALYLPVPLSLSIPTAT